MCLQVVLFFFSLLYYKGIYLLIVKRGKFHLRKTPKTKNQNSSNIKNMLCGPLHPNSFFWSLCFISLRAGPGGLELSRMACRRGWGSRLFGGFYSFGSPLLQVWFFYCIRDPSQNSLGTHSSGTREAGDRASPLYVPVFHSYLLGKEKKTFWEGLPLATSVSSG